MAKAGSIQAVTGRVLAHNAQGQVRELKAGDIVYENELIETPAGTHVKILLDNGNVINLAELSTVIIDETVTGEVDAYDAILHEVDMLQTALETGGDIEDAEIETSLGVGQDPFESNVDYHAGDTTRGDVGSRLLGVDGNQGEPPPDTFPDGYQDTDPDVTTGSGTGSATGTSLTASITIDANITPDDIINSTEQGANIAITGSVGGDVQNGDTVTLAINGSTFTGTVSGGTFSINVPGTALTTDANLTIDASVTTTDAAGNSATATDTETYTVDTTAAATITVDPITADDIVNAAEAGGSVNITGSVTGDARSGDAVSFTIAGTDYSGLVGAGNTFSISVAGADLAADPSFDATVTGSDVAGNPFTATTTSTHSVDTSAAATIAVDAITADDVVNTSEAGGNINVTGTVGGDATIGDTVSFTIAGTDYSGLVGAGNTFSISVAGADLAADTSFDATVTGSDVAGNPFTATTTSTHSVDTSAAATIAVDAITADDVVNTSEAGGNINVTGTVGGDATVGDTVSFTIAGTDYSGLVGAGNTFSISVAGADLAADTSFDATVTGSDVAGNPFSATTTSTHSASLSGAATISVNNISPDDVVNAAEAGASINVTGTVGGDASAGDTVSFTVNGNAYSGTVNPDGTTWSISVIGADLAADTSFDATVSGTDGSGNPFSTTTTSTHTVDTTAPTASITLATDIAGDDIINAAEAGTDIAITGTVGDDVQVGDTVTLTVDGSDYTGLVLAGNTFSIDVPGAKLVADGDKTIDASVTTTDAAGNTATANDTEDYSVDTTAPNASITLAADITTDDIINAAEAGTDIAITGTVGGDVQNGDTVTITVDGNDYTGLVLAGNTFSIDVPGAKLVTDGDKTIDASVTTTDAAGNTATANDTETYTVDTTAASTIAVDSITADDIVNAGESAASIAVTGTVGGDAAPGDSVSFTVNGNAYSGTVNADGTTWSISVAGADLAADTNFTATVTGNDAAGNPFTATAASTHTVDTAAAAAITVDNITADDIVNAAEAGALINVTGTVSGNAAAGDTVSFTVNGNAYSGTVNADGTTWSISVTGADLAADTSFDATVTGTDAAGNLFSAITTSTHSASLSGAATISIDAITPDDIVNAAEAGANINVTGTVGGDATAGDTVAFTVNGNAYSGTVNPDGTTWSISVIGADLAADTSFDVTVSGTDGSGNPFSTTITTIHTVDTSAAATITVDNITADDIVNATEAGANITVTGTVGGDAAVGDAVSMVINTTTYNGSVVDLGGGTLGFSISVSGADLAADTSFDATVTGNDNAGNPFTATTTATHTVDTTPPTATITLDTNITADDIINATEEGATVAISGDVAGEFQAGDIVTLTVNGVDSTGAVLGDGSFTINVQGSDLTADPDATINASFVATDAAGNTAAPVTDTEGYSVDATLPTASITLAADITADDIISAAEAGTNINITGSTGGDVDEGDTVTLTVNGTTYTGLVDASDNFSIAVAGSDLRDDGDNTIDASVTTSVGGANPEATATDTEGYSVDATLPTASITLDTEITADDIISAAEAGTNINITGSTGGNVDVGDTVTLTVNSATYTGLVDASGNFSIAVAGSNLRDDGDNTIDASVTTSVGGANPEATATDTETYTVDTAAAATISVNAITADDVVNASEAGGNINVTGTVGGDATVGDTVSFTIAGADYSGLVGAGNTFSISVAGADLAADTSFDAIVTGADAAGNPFSATTTSTHSINLIGSASITIDNVTSDDIVNAAEAGGSINVTGTVDGDAAAGDTIGFTINGTAYSGTVNLDGTTWSISVSGADLAADTSFDATVSGTDGSGNPFSATTASTHGTDLLGAGTITVDSITADDKITAAEAGGTVAVTGTVSGELAPGDTVSFTVNGTAYSGNVAADNTYSINVAGSDLAADTNFTVTATGTDAAGNPISASATSTHTVDAPSVLVADANTVNEDNPATGNVLSNDSDPDDTLNVTTFQVNGDATNYTAGDTATIAGMGTLEILADGSYTFTPAPNWNGAAPQVTYATNTGSTSTLDITVNPVDDASVYRRRCRRRHHRHR